MRGKIEAVSTSPSKGMRKVPQPVATLLAGQGVAGDAHAGFSHRQVSLLAVESIRKMQAMGVAVTAGDFAENITLSAIDLSRVSVGTRLTLGGSAVLSITQLGKECHERCAIYYQVDKGLIIQNVHLLSKSGGKSGDFVWGGENPCAEK